MRRWSREAEERFVAVETPFNWVRLATIAATTALYFGVGDRSHDRYALPIMAWGWLYNVFALFYEPHHRFPHRKTRWWTVALNMLTVIPWIAATGGLVSRYVPFLYIIVLGGTVRFPPREGAWVTLGFIASYLLSLLAMGQLFEAPTELAFQLTFVGAAGLTGMALSVVFLQQVELRLRVSEEAVRTRDELISVAGHDLRTPLTGAKLQLQLLERELEHGAAPSALAPGLKMTLRQVDKVGELTGELLDISRLTAGRLTLVLEELDLGELVRDMIARVFPAAPGTPPVSLQLDGPVVGHWDRNRVDQIAANLISNAVKYGDGKPVDVRVSRKGGTAMLDVIDHGPGIPPEEQERIFTRFHRLQGTLGKAAGTGLGLWITRKLVEAMGGRIHVASELGAGATFTVELPLAGPTPA